MFGLTRRIRVFAYGAPVDMRKSFNTLGALVKDLEMDLLTGDAYLFVSRRRNRAKVLWFDGTGLCLLAKRLETGRFPALWERATAEKSIRLTMSELSLFIEGCRQVGKMELSPPAYQHATDGRVFEKAMQKKKSLAQFQAMNIKPVCALRTKQISRFSERKPFCWKKRTSFSPAK